MTSETERNRGDLGRKVPAQESLDGSSMEPLNIERGGGGRDGKIDVPSNVYKASYVLDVDCACTCQSHARTYMQYLPAQPPIRRVTLLAYLDDPALPPT